MTATNLTDKVIYVKNLQRASKVEFNSKYGLLLVEVRRAKGSTIFEVFIDNNYKGVNFTSAESCYNWISEYLGVEVLQEIKPDKVVKKTGQSKWK